MLVDGTTISYILCPLLVTNLEKICELSNKTTESVYMSLHTFNQSVAFYIVPYRPTTHLHVYVKEFQAAVMGGSRCYGI